MESRHTDGRRLTFIYFLVCCPESERHFAVPKIFSNFFYTFTISLSPFSTLFHFLFSHFFRFFQFFFFTASHCAVNQIRSHFFILDQTDRANLLHIHLFVYLYICTLVFFIYFSCYIFTLNHPFFPFPQF